MKSGNQIFLTRLLFLVAISFASPLACASTSCLTELTKPATSAFNGITEKKTFTLPTYTTVGNRKIPNLSVGYETYGQMNAQGTNVIFIAHHYSGNSHAAGKYNETDKAPGYWDALIGPGKAIDTNKYFVVSADTLSNLYPFDPHVHTTGPSSINPETNKAYGKDFPALSVQDFVQVHRALLSSLGVNKVEAVVGASGGSIQAFTWAIQYPEFVKRIVAVITPGLSVAGTDAQKQIEGWAKAVTDDPAYLGGNYETQPSVGLAKSLAQTSHDTAINVDEKNNWAQLTFKTDWEHVTDQQKLDFYAAKLKIIDANNLVYTAKLYSQYNLEAKAGKIKAKVLMIPASSDKLFPPSMAERTRQILIANGVAVEPNFTLQGTGGHLDGILQINQASDPIAKFLKK